MKITAEMLFYRLSLRYPFQIQYVGTEGREVERIRMPGVEGCRENSLCLVRSQEEAEGMGKSIPMMLLICGPVQEPMRFSEECSFAALLESHSPWEIQAALLEVQSELLSWDARFTEAILHREDAQTVMAWGYRMLEWEYAVIDRDFVNIYQTDNYRSFPGKRYERVPPEIEQDLLMQSSFHAAGELKESFYYYEAVYGNHFLCRNVFMNGRYFARIVMDVGSEESVISIGARELFDVFADHLEELVNYNSYMFGNPVRDRLHMLVWDSASGAESTLSFRSSVLERAGWRNEDTYEVIWLRFYDEERWKTQLDTTLPYLIRELEGQWRQSCAVAFGQGILWVMNISLTEKNEDVHSFHQRLAFFVRDHVCNAGVSPYFHDFSLIPYAVRAAEAALRIGQAKQPHFWYFLFDDYRREYMLEKIREELPVSMLCHPAIERLAAYDREHKTELAKTLQTYLSCSLNMTAAAEKLYIHRTTFCRRMDHIRQLVDINITDPNIILELLISYQMFPL